MSTVWATALLAAAAITLVTTPLFRQLARSVGFFDEPAVGKVQTRAVPYLGGLAIAVGTLTGILAATGRGHQVGPVAFMATGLCALGLLDDDHHLRPRTRLTVEAVAAVATLALGLRLQVTGTGVVDGVLTVLWIIGLINAANLLDNMDGLGAGVAASMAGTSLFLALGSGSRPVAVLAAAVVGACVAFLAYNKRPASVYMGDAGSLFLGYLLAVITLAATQPLPSGSRLVVLPMLAAVPLTDTTMVVISRLRRGISPMQAGTDHLSHRLVCRGLAPGPAVAVLVTASLLVGVLGGFAGRGTLALPTAIVGAAIVLGLLLRAVLPARVYDKPVTGLPVRVRVAGAAGIIGMAMAWQGGFVPIDGPANVVPFHAPSFGPSLRPLVVMGAGFAVLSVTLLVVVCHRRRRATWHLSDCSVDGFEAVVDRTPRYVP